MFLDRDRIIEALKEVQECVVCSHYNPDPDAYGSLCGLALSLEAAGKKVHLLNESGSSEKLGFIPGVSRVIRTFPSTENISLLIACDCGSFSRIGDTLGPSIPRKSLRLANIDHHISNDGFGDLNWVNPQASSASEMIVELLEAASLPITKDVASALYVGILGDTGSFRYATTTQNTFRAAMRLMEHGARADLLAKSLFSNERLCAVRIQARALSQIQLFDEGRISLIEISRGLFEEYKAEQEDIEGLVDRARDIQGVQVAILVSEKEAGLWKVSLRSKSSGYDLNVVATSFGGGGHKAAAAFRSRKAPSEFLPLLLERIRQAGQRT